MSELTRRGFFLGSAAIILTPGLLMPVKKLIVPPIIVAPTPDVIMMYGAQMEHGADQAAYTISAYIKLGSGDWERFTRTVDRAVGDVLLALHGVRSHVEIARMLTAPGANPLNKPPNWEASRFAIDDIEGLTITSKR